MKGTVRIFNQEYKVDYSQPLDVSIPLVPNEVGPNCFFAPPPEAFPVRSDDFVGSVKEGSPVNFYNLKINPHGNGTHTECVGHISKEQHPVRNALKEFAFPCRLISVYPEKHETGDRIISLESLKSALEGKRTPPAIMIRTLPNSEVKLAFSYSATNPPYIALDAIQYMVEKGVKHLLIDLPSVDKEQDEGLVQGHKAFWKYPHSIRTEATISELLYIPDSVKDDLYLLHLYILNLELDVSPSRPILYALDS